MLRSQQRRSPHGNIVLCSHTENDSSPRADIPRKYYSNFSRESFFHTLIPKTDIVQCSVSYTQTNYFQTKDFIQTRRVVSNFCGNNTKALQSYKAIFRYYSACLIHCLWIKSLTLNVELELYCVSVNNSNSNGAVRHNKLSDRLLQFHCLDFLRRSDVSTYSHEIYQTELPSALQGEQLT